MALINFDTVHCNKLMEVLLAADRDGIVDDLIEMVKDAEGNLKRRAVAPLTDEQFKTLKEDLLTAVTTQMPCDLDTHHHDDWFFKGTRGVGWNWKN